MLQPGSWPAYDLILGAYISDLNDPDQIATDAPLARTTSGTVRLPFVSLQPEYAMQGRHPLTAPTSAPVRINQEHMQLLHPPRRVLIIDFDEAVAQAIAAQLNAQGVFAVSAENGSEALLLAPYFQPHAVFMHAEVPRNDGFSVLAALQSQRPASSTVYAIFGVDGVPGHQPGFDMTHRLAQPLSVEAVLGVLD